MTKFIQIANHTHFIHTMKYWSNKLGIYYLFEVICLPGPLALCTPYFGNHLWCYASLKIFYFRKSKKDSNIFGILTSLSLDHLKQSSVLVKLTLSWAVRQGRWTIISLTFTLDTMVGIFRRRYPLYSLSLAYDICERREWREGNEILKKWGGFQLADIFTGNF